MAYRQLLHKMEERFGAKQLPQAAQAQFEHATQNKGETMEDWADRVLTMATKAFTELPERYSNQQAISRFCQGLQDSMAGHHVCMQKPPTIEGAMNEVRLYQHTRKATFGKTAPRWDTEPQKTATDYDTSLMCMRLTMAIDHNNVRQQPVKLQVCNNKLTRCRRTLVLWLIN